MIRVAMMLGALAMTLAAGAMGAEYQVIEEDSAIRIVTPQLEAAVRKTGYVSGVAAGSLVDKKTGFHDPGFGLDIVDFILEPGDERAGAGGARPAPPLRAPATSITASRRKQFIEGPQICTQAKPARRPRSFAAATSWPCASRYHVPQARRPGPQDRAPKWTQLLVFPVGERYFLSRWTASTRSTPATRCSCASTCRATSSTKQGDTFRQHLPELPRADSRPSEFLRELSRPTQKFNYRRDTNKQPQRFVRAYQLRDPGDRQATGPGWRA